MSFESDLKRMEEIADLINNPETGMEDAIKLYEEANKLSKKLTATLEGIKRRIDEVTSSDENEFAVKEFDEIDFVKDER